MDKRTFLTKTAGIATLASITGCSKTMNNSDQSQTKTVDKVDSLPQPSYGSENKVTVQVFHSLQSSGSREFVEDHYPDMYSNYIEPNKIRYEYWDFPSESHTLSFPTSEIARSVQDRVGEDAFWDFTRRVLSSPETDTRSQILDVAEDVGSNRQQTKEDLLNHRYQSVVRQNKLAGRVLYNSSQSPVEFPLVFVNTEFITDPTYQSISNEIIAQQNDDSRTEP